MKKRIGILLVLTSLLVTYAEAQLRVNPPVRPLIFFTPAPSFTAQSFLFASATEHASRIPPPLHPGPTLPPVYRYEDLALFCRIEVQLEKATKIPIRFRLGSVDYVDYLEGKRNDPGPPSW